MSLINTVRKCKICITSVEGEVEALRNQAFTLWIAEIDL
jgi:hypothetical protein